MKIEHVLFLKKEKKVYDTAVFEVNNNSRRERVRDYFQCHAPEVKKGDEA